MSPSRRNSKRVQLTPKHWLNIMIISVSAMLLLSVLVGRMMNPESTNLPSEKLSSRTLHLIKLDFGEVQLTKQQMQWSAVNELLPQQSAANLAEHWQSLLNSTGDVANHPIEGGKTVLLYFAEIQQPLVCKVGISGEHMWVMVLLTKQYFEFPAAEFSNYFPD